MMLRIGFGALLIVAFAGTLAGCSQDVPDSQREGQVTLSDEQKASLEKAPSDSADLPGGGNQPQAETE